MRKISLFSIFILVALIGLADTPFLFNVETIPVEHSEEIPETETEANVLKPSTKVKTGKNFNRYFGKATFPLLSENSFSTLSFFSVHYTTPRFILFRALRY